MCKKDTGKMEKNVSNSDFPCCSVICNNKSSLRNNKEVENNMANQQLLSEPYRVMQSDQCHLGKLCMAQMLELNKVYGAKMFNIEPESWQTGLDDCGNLYAHQWTKFIKQHLGHGNHDRNSVRDYNIRFHLPMKLNDLEGLTPMDYCKKYCIFSSNRIGLYKRLFVKFRGKRLKTLDLEALTNAMNTILCQNLTDQQNQEIFDLFNFTSESKTLSADEFNIVCAVVERLYYQINLRSFSEDVQEMQIGPLETIDFYKLRMKIDTLDIDPSLSWLLKSLSHRNEK